MQCWQLCAAFAQSCLAFMSIKILHYCQHCQCQSSQSVCHRSQDNHSHASNSAGASSLLKGHIAVPVYFPDTVLLPCCNSFPPYGVSNALQCGEQHLWALNPLRCVGVHRRGRRCVHASLGGWEVAGCVSALLALV